MNDWLSDDELDSFTLDDDIAGAVIRKALNMPPKPPIDWPQVLSLPLWNESETICYIFGIDSELYENGLLDSSRQKFADDMRIRFEREAKAENLPHKLAGNEIFYNPNSSIAWAVHKGFPVIPELRDYISTVIENRTSVIWDGDIMPLEHLTDEEKQLFNNCAAWSWVDAIYILQGYKPVFQLSTEQVRSHFPNLVNYFTQSIQLGNIGKEIYQSGVKSFIDSPANWQAFWQSIDNKPEPKAEVVVDDVRQISESGNQRNERELKQGLRDIWVKEGRPEMRAFFPDKLKKYINQPGSPITAVYTAGKHAGFAFKLSTGTTGNRKKKTLSNYVSEFKKTP